MISDCLLDCADGRAFVISVIIRLSQRFIDSSFNEWCCDLEKKLNVLGRMTVNMSNTAILFV